MNKKINLGFTLTELVMVIVVTTIVAAGLASAVINTIIGIPRVETISTATALCAGEADRVRALPFASVADQNRDSPASFGGSFANYSWEVRVDSIDTAQPNLGSDPTMQNYKVVEVRVYNSLINYVSIKFLRTKYTE
jgi:prepilin-type N-terminal cleavage/methylation domain-containing protein